MDNKRRIKELIMDETLDIKKIFIYNSLGLLVPYFYIWYCYFKNNDGLLWTYYKLSEPYFGYDLQ